MTKTHINIGTLFLVISQKLQFSFVIIRYIKIMMHTNYCCYTLKRKRYNIRFVNTYLTQPNLQLYLV